MKKRRVMGFFRSATILPLRRSSASSGTLSSLFHTFSPNPNFEPQTPHIHNHLTPLQHLLIRNSKSGFDKLEDALSVFDKMLRMKPLLPVIRFNQLLAALVKMKEYAVSVFFFTDMCALSIPVDIYTFTTVINSCCHLHRLDFAFSMLGGIIKHGFLPNVVTYNTLIKGLISQDKFVEAQQLFKKLVLLEEIEPNVVTHNTIINGLCKQGDTSGAIRWLLFMAEEGCQPNTVTYNTVIDSLCKHGLLDDALHLHSDMIIKSIPPDVVTYSSLIDGLCNRSQLEKANLILKEMIDVLKISPDVHTFSILVNAYCKDGKVGDAERLVEIMIQRGVYPDIVTYTMLMDAYCKEMKVDKALDLFRQMVSDGLEPDVPTYTILIHGLCLISKCSEALSIFYKMQDRGYKPDIVTYTTLLDGMCKNHYVKRALSLFWLMECNGLVPNDITYSILVHGCYRNKMYNEACVLIDKMVCGGVSANAANAIILQQLISSKVQDPTLLSMFPKCLQLGMCSGVCNKTVIKAGDVDQGLAEYQERVVSDTDQERVS